MTDHWERPNQLGDTLRKFLATANAGGIGVLLTLAGSLVNNGVRPEWTVLPLISYSAGLIFVGVGYYFAQHRAIRKAEALDRGKEFEYKFPWYKEGRTWSIGALVFFIVGTALSIWALGGIKVPNTERLDFGI